MIGSELYFSLFVGIVLSLIFAEKFGINPAGLVVPGYLALIFDQPIMLLSFEVVEVSGIGVVIPGIIANTIQKQGVVITLATTMLLTCITYVILFLYSFIN